MSYPSCISILYVLSLFSCNPEITKNRDCNRPEKLLDLSRKTGSIAVKIADANRIEDKQIGEGGEASKVWRLYESLCEVASEQELIDLCNHSNAAVRAYSYQALAKRNSPDSYAVLLKMLDDTVQVSYQSGCIIQYFPVRDYLIEQVKPIGHTNSGFQLSTGQIREVEHLLHQSK